jgi:hypothetical protein
MEGTCKSQASQAHWLLRPIFKRELQRWTALEQLAVHSCEFIWAITQCDADAYQKAFGLANVAYWPVAIDLNRYVGLPIPVGDPDTMVHLGTLDSRKAPGLAQFLSRRWPELRTSNPRARLIVAGRVSMPIVLGAEECHYIGPVQSDVDVYREGRWSLNTQLVSAGVKLKSLTSMAAGRILLSTTVGVEGLDIIHGVHYLNYEILAAHGTLASIWDKTCPTASIAAAGREWVQKHHSLDVVSEKTAALIRRCLKC